MTDAVGVRSRVGRVRRGIRPLPVAFVSLASIEPFLGFLDRNRTEYVQPWVVGQVALATLVVVLAVYVVLLVAIPRAAPARIGASLAMFVFLVFRYGALFHDVDHGPPAKLAGWLTFTAVMVASVALWSRSQNVRLFLMLFLVILTFLPAATYAGFVLTKRPAAEAMPSGKAPLDVSARAERTPNVWWLMLDEYARGDVLEELYDFDNSAFHDDLRARRFTVADDSYTSYPATALAVSSVLDLDYIATKESQLRNGPEVLADPLRGKGRVVDAMEAHGYRYVYAESGAFDWAQCDRAVVDTCVGADVTGLPMGGSMRGMAAMTPLAEVRSVVRPNPVSTVRRVHERMAADQPVFVFAHILNPHYPLWYDDDCEFRPVADDDLRFFEDSYVHQVECLNPQVIEAVDLILDQDPDAMVIVQSDHGSKLLTDWSKPYDEWSSAELAERFSILEAMRFPAGCATPSGIHSNVSTFEFVLACIEGRTPEPIEERYFMWRYDAPTELQEIERPAAIGSD